jgi:hypothetical protein
MEHHSAWRNMLHFFIMAFATLSSWSHLFAMAVKTHVTECLNFFVFHLSGSTMITDAYRSVRKRCIKPPRSRTNVSCRPMENHSRLFIQALASPLLVHKNTSAKLDKLRMMNCLFMPQQRMYDTASWCSRPWIRLIHQQMLKPGYTMAGFNWHDQRGIEGTGFVRSLRTLLTNHLPRMTPDVRGMLERGFTRELAQGEDSLNGMLDHNRIRDEPNVWPQSSDFRRNSLLIFVALLSSAVIKVSETPLYISMALISF